MSVSVLVFRIGVVGGLRTLAPAVQLEDAIAVCGAFWIVSR